MREIYGEQLDLNNEQDTVLILSRIHDVEADIIGFMLAKSGINYIRLNADYFPEKYKVTFKKLRNNKSNIILEYMGEKLDLKHVKVVYYRHFDLEASNKNEDPIINQYLFTEWTTFLTSLVDFLDCRWINHPFSVMRATKLSQLIAAEKAGFTIPDTLVTNNPEQLQIFLNEKDQVIGKVVKRHHIEYAPCKLKLVHAHKISKDDLDLLPTLELAPVTFQEFIDNHDEVRVTVINDKLFAAKIINKTEDNDWHNMDIAEVKLEPYNLSEFIENKCKLVLELLSLEYGAIDLLITNNEIYFLEVNPIGDWRWVEFNTSQKIAETVFENLISYMGDNNEIKVIR